MLKNSRRWALAIGLAAVMTLGFLLTGPYSHQPHNTAPVASIGGHGIAPALQHAAQVANRPLTQQPAVASTPTPVPTSFPTLKCQIIADSAGYANCVVNSNPSAYTVLVIPDAAGAYTNYIGWSLTITLTYP